MLTIDRLGLEKIFCSIDSLNSYEYYVIIQPYRSPFKL